nr:uroporphyrinogen-III synthase [Rhodoligotrophos defluvii]
MRLVITRPRKDAVALADRLERSGHSILIEPLLDIVPASAQIPDLPYQAILLSSAHAARQLAGFAFLHGIPVLTVGEKTAAAASGSGFRNVTAAGGDAGSLLSLAGDRLSPEKGPVLYASGKHIARDLKSDLEARGFGVVQRVVYEARPADRLSEGVAAALSRHELDGAVLLSARTARIWCSLVSQAGLAERLVGVTHFCLSNAVAEAVGCGCTVPLRVIVAAAPSVDSIMNRINAV